MSEIERDIGVVEDDWQEALRQGDAARCAKAYHERAISVPPGEPMNVGKEAIIAFWQREIDRGVCESDFELIASDERDGLAYEVSRYEYTVRPPDGAPEYREPGIYLGVYQRQPDGRIVIVADSFNPQ